MEVYIPIAPIPKPAMEPQRLWYARGRHIPRRNPAPAALLSHELSAHAEHQRQRNRRHQQHAKFHSSKILLERSPAPANCCSGTANPVFQVNISSNRHLVLTGSRAKRGLHSPKKLRISPGGLLQIVLFDFVTELVTRDAQQSARHHLVAARAFRGLFEDAALLLVEGELFTGGR